MNGWLTALPELRLAFTTPWWLLLTPLALLAVFRHTHTPIACASLAWLPDDRASTRVEVLLRAAAAIGILALLAGLAGLHRPAVPVERIGTGAHLLLLLDRSRSMDQPFARQPGGGNRMQNHAREGVRSKGAVARELLGNFVERRGNDLFGMVIFSTFPIPVLPLTERRELVQAAIAAGNLGRGLAETSIAAGLEQALDMFEGQPFTGSRVVVLVSDGAGELALEERVRLALRVRKLRVSLYWLYLRTANGPQLRGPEADLRPTPERSLDEFFDAMGTPYSLFTAENEAALEEAIASVSRLQNLPLRYFEELPRVNLSRACFAIAALALALLVAARLYRQQESGSGAARS